MYCPQIWLLRALVLVCLCFGISVFMPVLPWCFVVVFDDAVSTCAPLWRVLRSFLFTDGDKCSSDFVAGECTKSYSCSKLSLKYLLNRALLPISFFQYLYCALSLSNITWCLFLYPCLHDGNILGELRGGQKRQTGVELGTGSLASNVQGLVGLGLAYIT